ncbi:response regulator [Methanospirillum stamsii]|uniref:Hybrid sensor histidine kinase/response regulator n=1 Tax=Methanospirillum stamsii TaxID=1277351 RepID=A0A2V2NHR7_9EURY|nr:hybrid sensor histidine kinase/response regulator [Methanospirillum stamsii]PWR75947.1 hypothetical protein DLD82_02490 [Methanospirillum stamsii]
MAICNPEKEKTILIVDDDENNLQLAAKIIHSAGFQVLLARDGLSALEICESELPDAIILDIMMPGMNGLDVCQQMREKEKLENTPIIFLSAAGEDEMLEKGLDCGGVDYVSKPVKTRILLARLKFHIERGILRKTICEKNSELDINNKKLIENEAQLKMAIQKLQLLSGITRHDILNKVTSLNGYMALIEDEVSGDEVTEYVTRAKENVETIRKQITFTRDYQQMGMHAPQWQKVQGIFQHVFRSMNNQSLIFETNLDGIECYADPLFERVCYNLIENSFRHGKNLTEIRIFFEIRGDNLILIYEDNGGGVPESQKENIFLRKYYKNSGFGLFLSKDILNITGLTIQEKGKEGTGVRFEITVPKKYYRLG